MLTTKGHPMSNDALLPRPNQYTPLNTKGWCVNCDRHKDGHRFFDGQFYCRNLPERRLGKDRRAPAHDAAMGRLVAAAKALIEKYPKATDVEIELLIYDLHKAVC